MRFTWAAICLICSVGSAAAQQMATISDVELPYAACGDMAALRNNLTGTPRSPRPGATPFFGGSAFAASGPRPRRGFASAIEEGMRQCTNKTRPPGGGRGSAQDGRGHRPGQRKTDDQADRRQAS